MKLKICAGIVTYNPDINRLYDNILAISNQVEGIYVYDNGSKNYEEIQKLISQIQYNINIYGEKENKGIACGLNRLVKLAADEGFEWILTLDQDSVVADRIIEVYSKYIYLSDVGIICCELTDRNVSKIRKGGDGNQYEVVRTCITSGALTNVRKVLEIGGFEERLFIDSVDYDICYSLEEHGYKTIKVNYDGLLHEVGKSKPVKIFGQTFAVNNHPAWRKYYISRNSVYMIKKHHLNALVEYFYVYRRIFTVLFFEQNKREKIKAILRGIHDGRRM